MPSGILALRRLFRARLMSAPDMEDPVSTFSPPTEKRVIAQQTARMMLEIQAIQFNATQPFVFTSGWASPVYVDCRKIISYPRMRSALMDFAASTILTEVGYESIDNIAGGETAGIPFAAWIADKLMLPMQYIRKKAKGFGRNAQIEGEVVVGARTLLVEDLATDGRSKVNFCNALRKAGAQRRSLLRLVLLRHLPDERPATCATSACSCTISRPGGTCWRSRKRAVTSMPGY